MFGKLFDTVLLVTLMAVLWSMTAFFVFLMFNPEYING